MKYIYINILLCATLLCGASNVFSQNSCEIPLSVLIADDANIPTASSNYLYNKLHKMIVDNGISEENGCRFVVSSNFTVLDKQILAGPPKSFVYAFEVNLFIGDYMTRKIYSYTTVSVKGVGQNETKAFNDAIKKINLNSPELKNFVENGKNKILDYYNSNYNTIIKEAQSMAQLKNYEEALYTLTSVPSCSTGYQQVTKATAQIYQQYIDQLCIENLSKAKTAWATQQDSYGAQEAGEYLAYIYPDASCYKEAQTLYKEIHAKVKDDWKFVMKMYNDQISLEQQRINAWKEVGVAYGKNQPSHTVSVNWIR